MNDQEIIALYWAKEERAISATAEKYGNYCHIIAYNILYDYFDAEECVNDTYLRAWNSIPPSKAEQIGCVSRKNHSQPRFESLQAQPCRKARGRTS